MTERSPLAEYPRLQIVSGLVVWGIIAFVGSGLTLGWRVAVVVGVLWILLGRFVLGRHRSVSE